MRVNKPQMQTVTCVCVHGNVHSDQSHLAVHLSMLLEDMAAFCFFFYILKTMIVVGQVVLTELVSVKIQLTQTCILDNDYWC